MWFPLDSGDALVTHLGMSGQVLLRDLDAAPDRHLRIQYVITHPEHGQLVVNFVDQRIFGSMAVDELVEQSSGLVPSQAAHIALDPLNPFFDDELFITRLRKKFEQARCSTLHIRSIRGWGYQLQGRLQLV